MYRLLLVVLVCTLSVVQAQQPSMHAFDSIQFQLRSAAHRFVFKDTLNVVPLPKASLVQGSITSKGLLSSDVNPRHECLAHVLSDKIDSLKPLSSPDTVLLHKFGAFIIRFDSLKPLESEDKLAVKQRMATLDTLLINNKLAHIPEFPDPESMPPITKGLNFPEADILSLNEPSGDPHAPALPEGSTFILPLQNINLPEGELKLPESVPIVNDVKNESLAGTLSEKLPSMDEASDKVQTYKDKLKDLEKPDLENAGELAESLESKAEALDEVDALSEQAEKMKALKEKWKDPQVMKEEALNKAKETAVNHFAGHEEELKAAMQKLSDLKAKYPHTEGTLDLFAKRQRPLKGIPFTERLLPGLTFQFQKDESFWLDLNPHLGFRISSRFISGVGWNERLAYDIDQRSWDRTNRIYGPRSYLHFKVKGGLYLKADAEIMNTPVRSRFLNQPSDGYSRAWVWSYFAGIKKDFQLSRTLKMNMQALYNLHDPKNRSPYTNRFNVRLGIEAPLHKRRKEAKSPPAQ